MLVSRGAASGPLPRCLLLACLRVGYDDAALDTLVGRAEAGGLLTTVAELARAHGVGPLVRARLGEVAGFRDRHPDWLASEQAAAQARHLHAMRTLALVTAAVDRPFLAFKGPALARWYGGAGLRTFSDVDVLTHRSDFGCALDALLAAGFTELASNWSGLLDYEVAEIPLGYELSCVDLHWDLLATGRLRRGFEVDVAEMFERAEPVDLGGLRVRTFDPVDTLLHLCLNAGLAGGRRLLQLVDVDRVVRHAALDWRLLGERAAEVGARALCSAVLGRCRRLLGTPVPEATLGELSPYRGWALLNRVVGERRRSPTRAVRGIGSGFVLSSGRDTPVRTAEAAFVTALDVVGRWRGRPMPTDPGGALDWQKRSPSGAQDRERYLRWVEVGA